MRKNKGFTLIELMIVIAIIAIIAAIAIPNLLQSRIRANETAAVSQARNYVNAQGIFMARDFSRIDTNNSTAGDSTVANGLPGWGSDNYRNLYYGNTVNAGGADTTACIRLISKAHADAQAAATGYTATNLANPETGPADGNGTAFNGYFFTEPGDIPAVPDSSGAVAQANFFEYRFAHVAIPLDSSRTGSKALFVDDTGTVTSFLLPANQDAATTLGAEGNATPLSGTSGWETTR